ncbi:MAG: ferritin-like domain-containing protein [Thermomicrobiales bacterium]
MTQAFDRYLQQGLSAQVTRRGLFKGTAVAGAGAAMLTLFGGTFGAGGVGATAATAAAPLDSDLDILNYALTLEYLEAAAYKAINDAGVLSGRAATYFKAFGQHEQDHVDALLATIPKLGGTPVAKPTFNFSSVPTSATEIVKFFQQVEAVGVSAYLGAAGSIKNFDVLEAALSIHAVEAEHASALADLVAPGTDLFSPAAFETPRTPDQVLAIVAPFLTPATTPGMPNTGGGYGASVGGGSFGSRR